MKTIKSLKKKIKELNESEEPHHSCKWRVDYHSTNATLKQTKEILEMIEEFEKDTGKMLINNSKCKCLNLTTKYRDILELKIRELQTKLKGEKNGK